MKTVWGGEIVGGGKAKEECDGGWSWLKYFIYMYENRITKPVKNWLKRGGMGEQKKQ
jgi:hypothetical protein